MEPKELSSSLPSQPVVVRGVVPLPSQPPKDLSPTRDILPMVFLYLERYQYMEAAKLLATAPFQQTDDVHGIWSVYSGLQLFTAAESFYHSMTHLEADSSVILSLYDHAMTVLNRATNHLDTLQRPSMPSPGSSWNRRDSKSYIEAPPNLSLTQGGLSSPMMLDPATAEIASFVNSLVKQLLVLTVLRKKIALVYHSVSKIDRTHDYDHDIHGLYSAQMQLSDVFTHPYLQQLKNNVIAEISVLEMLINSEKSAAEYEIDAALFHFYQARIEIESWQEKFLFYQGTSSRANFLCIPIYAWFVNFRDMLLEKLLFYFHSNFMDNPHLAIPNVERSEYHQRVAAFLAESKAFNVSLLLEPTPEDLLRINGLQAYPGIYTLPQLNYPREHWPNIISLLQDNEELLRTKHCHYFDKKLNVTYFLYKIQGRVNFVVIFNEEREEEDRVVVEFFEELASKLLYQPVLPKPQPM